MTVLDEGVCAFMIILLSDLVRMKSVSDRSCRQNQNIYFMLKTFSENRALLGDNVGKI